MKRSEIWRRLFFAAWALMVSHPVAARPLVDCPLRDSPFSSSTPLIDILLSPAATAAVHRDVPGMPLNASSAFTSTTPPSFASILDLRETAAFFGQHAVDFAAIDRDLARVPITRTDRIARCARYDTAAPALAVSVGRPRVLLFEKINGFRDGPSVDAAHAAFVAMAQRNRWAMASTDRGSAFTPAILRRFDVVIWNNVSGDVLTLRQRAAFRSYIEHGGGFVGIHGSAGDPVYFWDWYIDTLIGARFAGHPMTPQFQKASVRLEDSGHPVVRGLPATWEMNEEWYSFKTNPRNSGSHILATLDEATYKPGRFAGQNLAMGDHPIVWTRCVGPEQKHAGRAFYSAIGHRPEHYTDPVYVHMLEQAIVWAADRDGKGCR